MPETQVAAELAEWLFDFAGIFFITDGAVSVKQHFHEPL